MPPAFTSTRILKIAKTGASGLLQRPKVANDWAANLFLSIHHDIPFNRNI